MKISPTALIWNTQKFKGLTQWDFVPLGLKLTYTTANLKSLKNYLEANQFIEEDRWNKKTSLLPQPSTNLWKKQIRMSGLDTAHWKQFSTP